MSETTFQFPAEGRHKADALRLLRAHGVPASRVYGVSHDSILFVDQHGQCHTAWVTAKSTAAGDVLDLQVEVKVDIEVEVEEGFAV